MRFPLPLAIAAVLAGCASTPTAPGLVPTGPVVEELRVRGNDRVSGGEIRGAIATRETTRFLFFGSVHRLDPAAVAQDVRRIRDLYEEQGFYAARVDARVLDAGADAVEVEFLVEEGRPTEIRSLLVAGLEELPERVVAEVLDDPPLRRGDRFVEPTWLEWKETVRERLREQGYADAAVEARVEVAPREGTADVLLAVQPGRPYRFGEVRVVGNLLVEEEQIRTTAKALLEEGDRFSPLAMEEAREEVFELGAFSLVTVSARPEEGENGGPVAEAGAEPPPPGDTPIEGDGAGASTGRQEETGVGELPVTIAVNEADFLRIRLGAGVGLDQSFYQTRALAEFTHLNLFGGMRQLQWSNQIAYRLVNPASDLVGESGVAGNSTLTFTQPDFVRSRVDLTLRVGYERQLTPSYTAQSVAGRIGTPIRFRRWLYFIPSYNVTRFFDVSAFEEGRVDPVTPGVRPSLVGDCPAGCTLSWLEQQFIADRRDDPLEPRSGWYASLGLQEGGLGGDFAWLRLIPEARGYVPVSDSLVLAGRLRFGYLHPLSECEPGQALDPYLDAVGCSPIVVRFFGGGADGFRGVGADLLSPLRAVEVDGATRYIPLGGNSSLLGSGELRWYFAESWSSAFFLDAGNVAAEPGAAFDLSELQLALGTGLRYRTPVGPARLDVGYRLLRDPILPFGGDEPREQGTLDYFAIFLSIGEAF